MFSRDPRKPHEIRLFLRGDLPADPDANPLQIIICKEADREEMARSFYRLKSNEAIEAVYQQKLKVGVWHIFTSQSY